MQREYIYIYIILILNTQLRLSPCFLRTDFHPKVTVTVTVLTCDRTKKSKVKIELIELTGASGSTSSVVVSLRYGIHT